MSDPVTEAIERVKAAALAYLKSPTRGQTFSHLLAEVGLQRGRYIEGLPESRVLDRALQSLRKSGKIRFEKSEWRLTGSGWDLGGITTDFFSPTHIFTLLDDTEIPARVEMRGDPVADDSEGHRWMTVMGVMDLWWVCTTRGVLKLKAVRKV